MVNDQLITILEFDEVTSTQDLAKEFINDGKYCHGLVFKSKRQTKGRGRLSRIWESQDGGLWLSLVIQKKIPLKIFHGFSVRLGLRILKELEKILPLNFKIKWPNDLIISSKKVGGILIELSSSGEFLSYMICGVGINVNNSMSDFTEEVQKIATTLTKETKLKTIDISLVEKSVTNAFSSLLDDFENNKELEDLTKIWEEYSETINQEIRLEMSDETITGLERGISPNGDLLIEIKDGSIIEVQTGDVFLLRKTNSPK